jgi:hypothetical protein
MAAGLDSAVLSPAVAALVAAVDAVLLEVPAELPGPLALEETRALLAAKERLDVHLLRRLRDVEVRELHQLDAMPTASTWIETEATSLDRGSLALARRLDRLPIVQGELEARRLSMPAARKVARAMERVRGYLDRIDGRIDGQPGEEVLDGVLLRGVPQLFGEALGGVDDDDPRLRAVLAEMVEVRQSGGSQVSQVEAAFVAVARRVESGSLSVALDRLVDALLPLQLEARAHDVELRRGLVMLPNAFRPGGRMEVEFGAEGWELFNTVLTAAMATDPDNVLDTAAAAALREHGIDPYGESAAGLAAASLEAAGLVEAVDVAGFSNCFVPPRNKGQRRYDAFMSVLRDLLDSASLGTRGKAVPHISIRVGADALHDQPGALPAVGGSGQSLPASLVRRLLCDSAVTRFVMGLGNKVIEMSHTARTIKEHERKAKIMETGGVCQAAGCHHPPGLRLIPHHPDAYAKTGTTSFYDTVMLCEPSHNDVHEGGKTIRLKDGRLLSADGWVTASAA